jgi:sterol 3beta-glucosyltransferase
MNITILAVGTRGDVQPYIALGAGLRVAGHDVTLATSGSFGACVSEYGLRYAMLSADFLKLVETPEGKAALAGKNPLGLMKRVMPMLRRMLDDAWAAAQGADAIIYHPKALGGYHIAEKLGVPAFLAHPLPMFTPTRAFPSPLLPFRDLGGFLNRLSHSLALAATTAPYRKLIDTWRAETLGLPPSTGERLLHGRPVPQLYAYSPHVLPPPADWGPETIVTGYWFLPPRAWQPPAALAAFLADGEPPIYVGFGSMASRDAGRVTDVVLEALARTGLRAVLATGQGGLAAKDAPNVCVIDAAPHDWLFPRVAAVVHHGGAGTTAAGLLVGAPTLICPFLGDQPFWGRRVHELGAGAAPIPQKRLTAERLAGALRQITGDAAMRERAAALGARIRAEDGVARAVAAIGAQVGQALAAAV